MTKFNRIQTQDGFVLLVFILAIIIGSFAITTALLSISAIEETQRELYTIEKIQRSMHEVGVRDLQTESDVGGADISYLNENGAFPTNMSTFISAGYLYNFGMTSAQYTAEMDGYGDDLAMARASGVFEISSTNISDSLTVTESLYVSNDLAILVHDLTKSSDLTTTLLPGDALDNTYIEISSGTLSGVCDIDGNLITAFSYPGATAGLYTASGLTAGCYEIRLVQNAGVHGGWMETGLGIGNTILRCYIIIYPTDNATVRHKFIRFPFDVIVT